MLDTTLSATEPAPTGGREALTNRDLTELVTALADVGRLGGTDEEGATGDGAGGVGDAERIDRIDALERIRAACAAAQVRVTAQFVDSQARQAQDWRERAARCSAAGDFEGWRAAREQARNAEFEEPGQQNADRPGESGRKGGRWRSKGAGSGAGVAARVGLARCESPARASHQVSFAVALARRLLHTLAALTAGTLGERRAQLVVKRTSHLSEGQQRLVDAQVIGAASVEALGSWGDRELERRVRACADRIDAAAAAARAATAERERRVGIRPIPDTMAIITGVLPVAQAVAVYVALAAAAAATKAAGDPRGKGQVMADTLVERVTGQATADGVPVEVQIIITDRALLAGGDEPAQVPGYGPVPAGWARDLLTRHLHDDHHDHNGDGERDAFGIRRPAHGGYSTHPGTGGRSPGQGGFSPRRPARTEQGAFDPERPEQTGHTGAGLDPGLDRFGTRSPHPPNTHDVNTGRHGHHGEFSDENDIGNGGHGHFGEDDDFGSHADLGGHFSDGDFGEPDRDRDRDGDGDDVGKPGHARTDENGGARGRAKVWFRRLFTHPDTGTLVAMDSRRRLFEAGLRRFLIARDGTCRTPWCDAPIGRPTTSTLTRPVGLPARPTGKGCASAATWSRTSPAGPPG